MSRKFIATKMATKTFFLPFLCVILSLLYPLYHSVFFLFSRYPRLSVTFTQHCITEMKFKKNNRHKMRRKFRLHTSEKKDSKKGTFFCNGWIQTSIEKENKGSIAMLLPCTQCLFYILYIFYLCILSHTEMKMYFSGTNTLIDGEISAMHFLLFIATNAKKTERARRAEREPTKEGKCFSKKKHCIDMYGIVCLLYNIQHSEHERDRARRNKEENTTVLNWTRIISRS